MTEASEAVKGCKIKEMSSTAKGLKGYKMDEVISIMAVCSHSVFMLKQKAAILYTNKRFQQRPPGRRWLGSRKPRVQNPVDSSSS